MIHHLQWTMDQDKLENDQTDANDLKLNQIHDWVEDHIEMENKFLIVSILSAAAASITLLLVSTLR